MPEQSKFSGALAKLNQRPAGQPIERDLVEQSPIQSIPPQEEPGRGKGRPLGKRSDPAYQPTTVILRKQTKKAANRQLEDEAAGQDLSDLIEELLTQWMQKK